jgi:hypothetical protein
MKKPISLNRLAVLLLCLAFLTVAAAAQSTGGVKGKVRTTKGSGIPSATVTARKKGVDVKTTKANSSGDFVLDGLETGRYNVVFEAPGYSSGVLYNVEVSKNKTSDLGDRLILTPDQGNQIIVKGSVFDKQGFSVPGAKIEIERVNADGSVRTLGNTFTSSDGEFTFRPQSAAKIRVTATYKGVTGTKDIDVDEPAIYRLAINLDIPPRSSN